MHSFLYFQKGLQVTPAVFAAGIALRKALAQWDCSLVQNKMNILGLPTTKIAITVRRQGLWCVDDLNIETGSERRQVGHGKLMFTRIVCCRKFIRELAKTKSSENRNDIAIMGEVEVKTLVQWECYRVVVQGYIYLRARISQGVVSDSGNYLLLIPNTNRSLFRGNND